MVLSLNKQTVLSRTSYQQTYQRTVKQLQIQRKNLKDFHYDAGLRHAYLSFAVVSLQPSEIAIEVTKEL